MAHIHTYIYIHTLEITAMLLSSTTIKNYMGSADDSMQTVLHYIVPSDVIINYTKGFV